MQSKDGVVAQVKVTFDITSQLRLGVLKLGGTARTSVVTSEALARSHSSCTDVYERCGGGCKASVSSTGSGGQRSLHLACGYAGRAATVLLAGLPRTVGPTSDLVGFSHPPRGP